MPFRIVLALCTMTTCVTAWAGTAVVNLNGYTMTGEGLHRFSVLVVDDQGHVAAAGGDDTLADFPAARRVDLQGHTVLPGLTDGHAHIVGLGQLNTRLDLSGIRSLDAAIVRIKAYRQSNPQRRWLLGRGWNQVLWPVQAFPRASDIDAVVADKPVWLRRVDGHAGWANTTAMAMAGITKDTPDPVGGKILRDDNGNATGIFVDKAMLLIQRKIPAPSKSELRTAIGAAMDALIAEGITSVHDAGVDLLTIETYLGMADDDALPVRVYAMIRDSAATLDSVGKPLVGYGNDRLDIAAVKLVADGALGSRGAAMIEPYSDDAENRGLPFWTQSQLTAKVARANDLGFQVGIHAIGDLGNRMALDAFEVVQNGAPSPLRNRIEHAQIVRLEDIPRFATLGVIAAVQATHATSDMNMAEKRIGSKRIAGGYAWRRLLEAGAVLANGSDFPVELSNPFYGLYASVSRKDRDGKPADGWYADQALTREEALRSFTLDAAFAAHQESRLGSLEPGKWADFIVIDRDYFAVDESEIDDIRVLRTYSAGKLVYRVGSEGGSK